MTIVPKHALYIITCIKNDLVYQIRYTDLNQDFTILLLRIYKLFSAFLATMPDLVLRFSTISVAASLSKQQWEAEENAGV